MVQQISDLSNRKVIIPGGSAGLGFATAKAAAEEGAHVVIVSSSQKRLDEALTLLPDNCKGVAVDFSQENNIKSFFEKTGDFDHLVYTAGENLALAELSGTNIDQARQFFNLRYWGAFAAVKYGSPFIRSGGSINLTSGIASSRPGRGWAVASSICAAMEGFTRAMAVELAPIRVNCVKPGIVRTNLWDGMSASDRDQFYAATASKMLVGKIGEADHIAQAFLYLMKQSYGTGQCLVIDGGAELV